MKSKPYGFSVFAARTANSAVDASVPAPHPRLDTDLSE